MGGRDDARPDPAGSVIGVVVHPDARCESLQVGAGTHIWAFAHVLDGAIIGTDCNLGDGVFVEGGARIGDRVTVKNAALIWNGVTIGDEVFIGPRVTFTNDRTPRSQRGGAHRPTETWLTPTVVECGASLGANVTVVAGVRIGAYAMIGAGTVVTRDVPPHGLVLGNPGRLVGWVAHDGTRLDAELVATSGAQYRFSDPADPSRGLELRGAPQDLMPSRSH